MSRTRKVIGITLFAFGLVALIAWWFMARDPAAGTDLAVTEVDIANDPVATTSPVENAATPPAIAMPASIPPAEVVAMRTRALAGDGQAAWWMVQAFEQCHGRELQDDDQVRAANQSRFEENLARMEQSPRQPTEADIQQLQQSFDAVLAHELDSMADLRARCSQLTMDDEARVMDWLDLALASDQRDLLARLNVVGGLPMARNQAWLIRNAERMATFIERAREAYQASTLAGDRRLLQRASFFQQNPDIWPEIDYYQAYVYGLATMELGRVEQLDWPVSEYQLGQLERHLDDQQREQARQAANALFRRCCAGSAGRP